MDPMTDLGDVSSQQKDIELETELEEEQEEQGESVESEEEEGTDDDAQEDEGRDEEGDEGQEEPAEEQPQDQRKEIQERLLEQDKEFEEYRATLKQEWQDIEAAHDQIQKAIPNPIPLNGKPAYLATDEEFEAAEDAILDSGDKNMLAALKQARKERREYLKRSQALAPKFQKIQQERTKQTMEDVGRIKDALKDISSEYEKHFNDIENLLREEFEANPAKLERFVWGGIRDKFRVVDRLLDESGIKQRVEKEIRTKERPNLAAPVGAGKAKRGTPTGKSKGKIYSRSEVADIAKNKPDLYDKLEADIDKAMAEGRIK